MDIVTLALAKKYTNSVALGAGAIQIPGPPGKSAYQIWLDKGNTGTEADFLQSIKGQPGGPGKSAFQVWLDEGNTGTVTDFLESLEGLPGDDGDPGKSAFQIWLDEGNSGTEADFLASLIGPPGSMKGDAFELTRFTITAASLTLVAFAPLDSSIQLDMTKTYLVKGDDNGTPFEVEVKDNEPATLPNGLSISLYNHSGTVIFLGGTVSEFTAITAEEASVVERFLRENQGVANEGKFLRVGSDGNVTPEEIEFPDLKKYTVRLTDPPFEDIFTIPSTQAIQGLVSGNGVTVMAVGSWSGSKTIMVSRNGVSFRKVFETPASIDYIYGKILFGAGRFLMIARNGKYITSTNGFDWTHGVIADNPGNVIAFNFANGRFILFADNGIYWTTNATTWTKYAYTFAQGWDATDDITLSDCNVVYEFGKYFLIGYYGGDSLANPGNAGSQWARGIHNAAWSTDLENWTFYDIPYNYWQNVASGNGCIVAFGDYADQWYSFYKTAAMYSLDGFNWNEITEEMLGTVLTTNYSANFMTGYSSIVFGNGRFYLSRSNTTDKTNHDVIFTSENGQNWEVLELPDGTLNSDQRFVPNWWQIGFHINRLIFPTIIDTGYNTPRAIRFVHAIMEPNYNFEFDPVYMEDKQTLMHKNEGLLNNLGEINAGKTLKIDAFGNIIPVIPSQEVGDLTWKLGGALPWAPQAICYSKEKNLWVIVRSGTTTGNWVATSPDGLVWTERQAPAGMWNKLAYGNGMFVAAVSTNQTTYNKIMSSPDGITWTARQLPQTWDWPYFGFQNLVFANGIFISACDSSNISGFVTSPDGITWTGTLFAPAGTYIGTCTPAFGNGKWVTLGRIWDSKEMFIISSTDNGATWTVTPIPQISGELWISAIVFFNELWVGLSQGDPSGVSPIFTSPDGTNWTPNNPPTKEYFRNLLVADFLLITFPSGSGSMSRIFATENGKNWTPRTIPAGYWVSAAYGQGKIIVVPYTSPLNVLTAEVRREGVTKWGEIEGNIDNQADLMAKFNSITGFVQPLGYLGTNYTIDHDLFKKIGDKLLGIQERQTAIQTTVVNPTKAGESRQYLIRVVKQAGAAVTVVEGYTWVGYGTTNTALTTSGVGNIYVEIIRVA